MATDISKYQDIINKLKPIIKDPEFDTLMTNLTPGLSKPTRFLLKMELKRLASPSTRVLDLRGHVDGTCKPYPFEGRTHYLDENAVEVFEQSVRMYGGYTTGVYEEVNNTDNNFRVMHKKAQQAHIEKLKQTPEASSVKPQEVDPVEPSKPRPKFAADSFVFADYDTRSEERMNFAIKIQAQLMDKRELEGQTSDISVAGCKVRLEGKPRLVKDQQVLLFFKGLEEEYTLGDAEKEGVPYQVIESTDDRDQQIVRLKRIHCDTLQDFTQFLQRFISGNKRRYKVNLENTLDAVINKGFEQFYLPRTNSLAVFLGGEAQNWKPHFLLTADNTRDCQAYWSDEQQEYQLGELLRPRRMQAMLEKKAQDHCGIVYAFTHVSQGKQFYYSATAEELEKTGLRELFIGFGVKKSSWRTYKMQIVPVDPEDAYLPLTIPDSASEVVKKLNRKPSPRVIKLLEELRYLLHLTDITDSTNSTCYKNLNVDKTELKKLNVFLQKKVECPTGIETIPLSFINLRKETRYRYKTPVKLTLKDGTTLEGMTRDFSTKGMQVELGEAANLKPAEGVLLEMPAMQKLTEKYRLHHLAYEVVRLADSKDVLNLRIVELDNQHQGRLFFRQLISSNKDKLTAAEESPKEPGLPYALRNLYCRGMVNTPFYVQRSGTRYYVENMAQGQHYSPVADLMQHFSDPDYAFNLYPLLRTQAQEDFFFTQLRNLTRQHKPVVRDLYIMVKRLHKKADQAIFTQFSDSIRDDDTRKEFIHQSTQEGLFVCWRVYLSRTGRPDTDFIANELNYVSHYAIHKAKHLEDILWSVVGVGEIIDVTDEAMLCHGFSVQDIQEQKLQRAALFKP